ncbi:hydantoinase/oxoprolinase family protein [Kordiimonas pumila]|uniref:Hydantoinase/oxoprolinase family protein n=1 Tax=Kordiimonas pumila TaxID=2161677 RepID=A0ABV7D8A4_9PROT|nr:hydantoinase/oxoprolinase family protein [Kordiimonas pumila]
MGLLVSIDNGGTLTDICAFDGNKVVHAKTLTTPHDLTECLMTGLSALSDKLDDKPELLELVASIDHLRYSTTQGTNAIAQRKGPRIGILLSDEKQKDALYAASPELFDAFIDTRFSYVGGQSDREVVQTVRNLVARGASRLVVCLGGDSFAANEPKLKRALYAAFPRHLLGAVPLLFSADLVPGADATQRGWTSVINAFLHPSMEQFLHNAEEKLRYRRIRNPLLIFRNDGSSTRVSRSIAINTYSSGPRGGAEGVAVLAALYGNDKMVSIDIGGTTTDHLVLENGKVAEDRCGHVEDAPVAFPMARINSVAVGGGSILKVVDGTVKVGPESVGSLPGPACFGRGGTEATITDVLLVAGLFDPKSFFGGKLVLDRDRALRAVTDNIATPLGISLDVAITRAVDAYDEKIAKAIACPANGDDVTTLMAFGGAGPMSACGIAEKAGINTVLIPRYAAVFSAFGIGFSPIRHVHSKSVGSFDATDIEAIQAVLMETAARSMTSEGFDIEGCELVWRAVVGTAVMPLAEAPAGVGGLVELEVVRPIPTIGLNAAVTATTHQAKSSEIRDISGGLPLYKLEELAVGDCAAGPCLVEEEFFTAWIKPGWQFTVTANNDLLVERKGE